MINMRTWLYPIACATIAVFTFLVNESTDRRAHSLPEKQKQQQTTRAQITDSQLVACDLCVEFCRCIRHNCITHVFDFWIEPRLPTTATTTTSQKIKQISVKIVQKREEKYLFFVFFFFFRLLITVWKHEIQGTLHFCRCHQHWTNVICIGIALSTGPCKCRHFSWKLKFSDRRINAVCTLHTVHTMDRAHRETLTFKFTMPRTHICDGNDLINWLPRVHFCAS